MRRDCTRQLCTLLQHVLYFSYLLWVFMWSFQKALNKTHQTYTNGWLMTWLLRGADFYHIKIRLTTVTKPWSGPEDLRLCFIYLFFWVCNNATANCRAFDSWFGDKSFLMLYAFICGVIKWLKYVLWFSVTNKTHFYLLMLCRWSGFLPRCTSCCVFILRK